MVRKHGRCSCCGGTHEFSVTGWVRTCGTACVIGSALGLRKPAMAALAFTTLVWGDEIEEWIKARCPDCGTALEVVGLIARA